MPVKGIIFDFDGVIVDTESAIYESWAEVYREHGETLALADYVNCVGSDFLTFSPEELLESRLGRKVDWPEVTARKDLRIREALATQPERPGVRELLGQLDGRFPLAIASSSSREWVEGWLHRLDLLTHFAATRCRDDVERVKPDPALFVKAAEALGHAPSDCLVIEDSANGVKAARAAGIGRVIVVHNPITNGADFSAADAVFDCFQAFQLIDHL